jgi:hypothetical protein
MIHRYHDVKLGKFKKVVGQLVFFYIDYTISGRNRIGKTSARVI